MKTILLLGVVLLVTCVLGHDVELGGHCDESGEGEHDHSLFCNPSLNLVCVANFCVCSEGHVPETDDGTARGCVDPNPTTTQGAATLKVSAAVIFTVGAAVFKYIFV
ncbi:hypothetical protein Fcan01_08656 [Folsomia candida]|uniref:Uncharacterized protein n=1 Tax=Folsomia candida TaxID=158441 RepID=A0A226EEY1_FOLCA|nr:hypothetical protein Fcan01_08656 [Folsomia candida]